MKLLQFAQTALAATAPPAAKPARRGEAGKAGTDAAWRQAGARRLLRPQVTGMLGVAGVLAMSLMLAAALALFPHFSFWDDNLSVLGVSSVAPLFNGGAIICGVLGALLALAAGLHLAGGKPLRLMGAAILACGMAILAAIGVFTEAFGMLHFYIAVAFFALFISASLALGISFAREPAYRRIGYVALFSAALGMVAWFLPTGEGIAIPELVASVPGLAWLGLLGMKMANLAPAAA